MKVEDLENYIEVGGKALRNSSIIAAILFSITITVGVWLQLADGVLISTTIAVVSVVVLFIIHERILALVLAVAIQTETIKHLLERLDEKPET